MSVVRKPPSQQTRAEKLKNLKAARLARKRNIRRKSAGKRNIRKRRKAVTRVYVNNPVRRRMKRRRTSNPGNHLTGGTKDINPQYYSGYSVQTANDTTSTSTYVVPVPRYSAGPTQSIVMEVLKVYFDTPEPIALASDTEKIHSVRVIFSTKDHATTEAAFSASDVFAKYTSDSVGAFTAAGTYRMIRQEPFCYDCSDGMGHGILIASDTFSVQIASTGTGQTNGCSWKLLYRFKRVSLSEYIGIVQSQQY